MIIQIKVASENKSYVMLMLVLRNFWDLHVVLYIEVCSNLTAQVKSSIQPVKSHNITNYLTKVLVRQLISTIVKEDKNIIYGQM